jgi:hypothetical protein
MSQWSRATVNIDYHIDRRNKREHGESSAANEAALAESCARACICCHLGGRGLYLLAARYLQRKICVGVFSKIFHCSGIIGVSGIFCIKGQFAV